MEKQLRSTPNRAYLPNKVDCIIFILSPSREILRTKRATGDCNRNRTESRRLGLGIVALEPFGLTCAAPGFHKVSGGEGVVGGTPSTVNGILEYTEQARWASRDEWRMRLKTHGLYPADAFLEETHGRQGQLSTINSTVHWTSTPRPPPFHSSQPSIFNIVGTIEERLWKNSRRGLSKEPGNIQVGLGLSWLSSL